MPVHSPQAHPPMTLQSFPPQSAPQQPIPQQFPSQQHIPPKQQFPPQQSMPQQLIRPQCYQQRVSNQAIPSQTPLQTSQLSCSHVQTSFQHRAGVAPSSSFLAGPVMSQGGHQSFGLSKRVVVGFRNFAWAPNWSPPTPRNMLYLGGQRGVFSKVVLGIRNFGYDI